VEASSRLRLPALLHGSFHSIRDIKTFKSHSASRTLLIVPTGPAAPYRYEVRGALSFFSLVLFFGHMTASLFSIRVLSSMMVFDVTVLPLVFPLHVFHRFPDS